MSEVLTPSLAVVKAPVQTQQEAIQPRIEPEVKGAAQPEQSVPGIAAPIELAKPLLPPNPESAWAAFGKGLVEAGADFAIAATTPYGAPNPEPVRIFNKSQEQNLTIPDAAREAFRRQTAEQIIGKRAMKEEQLMQRKEGAPEKLAAMERRAEPDRLQRLAEVRTQIARLPTRAPMQIAA